MKRILRILASVVCTALHAAVLVIVHANYLSYSVFYYDTRLIDIIAMTAADAILIAAPYIIQKHTPAPFYDTKAKCIGLSVFSGLLFFAILGVLISVSGVPLDIGSILLLYLPEAAIQIIGITAMCGIKLRRVGDRS